MFKIKITQHKPNTKFNKSNTSYVNIALFASLPVIKTDPRIGPYIADYYDKFISNEKHTFEEMSIIMKAHNVFNWKQLTLALEKLYNKRQ